MLKKFFVFVSLFAVAFTAAAAAAKLNYQNLTIPALKPVGSGDLANSVVHYLLRGQHILLFSAKDGEKLNVVVKHFGGTGRPDISYAFLDQSKKLLREGVIANGKLETVSYQVEKGGTYALVISSGSGAVAWYSLATKNPFAAILAEKEVYLFSAQKVFLPGKAMGNSEIAIRSTKDECYSYSVDGGKYVELLNPVNVKIQLTDKTVTTVQFGRIAGKWCQNFMLSFPDGKQPLIFYGENRAVEIVK